MLFSYGWGKLMGTQFGISPTEMQKTIGESSLFTIGWYLFYQQPFRCFIGISQLLAGGMLLYNRTALLGAFMALPIWINIMVIDYTVMGASGATAFGWRIGWYIVLEGLIMWHSKARIIAAFQSLTAGLKPRFKFPVWAYLLLPVGAILLEILPCIPQVLFQLFTNPAAFLDTLKQILH